MATTYTLINSNVLTSSAASVTFSSIPATYTDLVLRMSVRESSSSAGSPSVIRFNGAGSGTNLSQTYVAGSGSSASSNRVASFPGYLGQFQDGSATASTFGSVEIYIPSYLASQSKPFSTVNIYENNSASLYYIEAIANLFSDSTAISSIEIVPYSTSTFVSGSSFYLYGISNA